MESEIKGVWLVTARSWVLHHHGSSMLERIAGHIEPELRSALTDPLTSTWYPERVLAQALKGLREEVAHGSADEFRTVMESCTALGVSTFFRVLLRLSSPRFVLRQVPTMWRQIRRGSGRVEVTDENGKITIRYREFPWFDDVNYRLLTVGSLTALLRVCTRRTPRIRIQAHGIDWLDIVVDVSPDD
jgi:hypothetical protein